MTRTQIECFFTVLRTLSFTKAANKLYISQPAISRNISKLEEEFGFRLFERTGGELTVTEGGKLMYDFLVAAEHGYKDTLEEIKRINGASGKIFRIGCPELWNPCLFTQRFKPRFEELYPGMRLTIEPYRLSELLSRLSSGWFDAVVSHEFYVPLPNGPVSERLTETNCGILYSREHFPNVKSPADFADANFLLFDIDISKRFASVIEQACSDYAFQPKIKNVSQTTTALFETANGKGVMFFSEWDSDVYNSLYGFMQFKMQLPVNLVYFPDRLSDFSKTLIEELKASFVGTDN